MTRGDGTENPESGVERYYWTKQLCPICEIEPSKLVGKRGGTSHREGLGVETQIWRCGRCGLVFPNPMPCPKGGLGQHYDMGADDYFSSHDKDQKLENALDLINEAETILGRKGRLLDVGVGRGETLLAAKDRGWEVEGVEPSETFADYAEERTGARIWRQPVEESELCSNSYDVVILAAVLEHLYNPSQIVGKVSDILVKGGLLYLDVPNESGLYFKVGNAYQRLRGRNWCVNLAPTFPPYHVFGFSPKSLKRLLAKHHLKPEVWRVYAGTSLVPNGGGVAGLVESVGSKIITALSSIGETGTYIETWARKQ
jgi:2-polyprenyl-3-methyl-5-hydroxy-6-metoxy-1,4-benzoquinol methylase